MNIYEAIIDLAYTSGVSHVVLAEGSKFKSLFNTWKVNEVFDRRSAAYFAVGVAQEAKSPVLLLIENMNDASLSDTLPGITEAYYQNVPILILGIKAEKSWMKDAQLVIGDKCVFHCSVRNEGTVLSEKSIANINYAITSLTEYGGGPVFIECSGEPNLNSMNTFPRIKEISPRKHYAPLA